MKPIIVIPAFEPGQPLIHLVELLSQKDFHCIVVDDGSSESCQIAFESIIRLPNVIVLKHAINLGKGQALKTAFNCFLNEFAAESPGIVTADADGQHQIEDIIKVSEAVTSAPQKLWLGARMFEGVIPLRSAFGNSLTRKVFELFVGQKLSDTQTGLRGVPVPLAKDMLKVASTGYEFELEMLIRAISMKIPIAEIPIKTIYEDNNASSHFNPVLDSLKIYFVFLRFSALSLFTAFLDFAVFVLVQSLSGNILQSAIWSRSIAGIFNFSLGKFFVFKSKKNFYYEFVKYVLTVATLGFISFELIHNLVKYADVNVYAAKIFTETGLFLISFALQRTFVFGSSKEK